MKIAFFTDTYHPDVNGVVTSIDSFAKELRKQGHEVYIVSPVINGIEGDGEFVLRVPAIEIYPRFDVRAGFPIPSKNLLNLLKVDFDIIHSHGSVGVGWFGNQLAKIRGIPYVLTYHTLLSEYVKNLSIGKVLTPKMITFMSKSYCNQTDSVVAPSEKIKKELLKWGITKPISIINNAINLEKFSPGKSDYLVKKGYAKENEFTLLFVGRLAKEKNVEFLLKSFSIARKKNNLLRLVLVGDGSNRHSLEKLTIDLGIKDSVTFTGVIPIEEAPNVYKGADVFVMASVTEVHPMVVLEAISSGLPVIVINDLAYKGIVKNNQNGLITKLDINSFASAILKLSKDVGILQKMGLVSRKMAEQDFNIERLTSKLVDFYVKSKESYQKLV